MTFLYFIPFYNVSSSKIYIVMQKKDTIENIQYLYLQMYIDLVFIMFLFMSAVALDFTVITTETRG